jgi:hypothetical protein
MSERSSIQHLQLSGDREIFCGDRDMFAKLDVTVD